MKQMKRCLALGLAVLMMLGLTACKEKFDASGYVKATLDTITRNDVTKFMELTKSSKEEAEKVYSDNIAQAAEALSLPTLSEELGTSYNEYMKKVLAKTKYNVLEAKETENGYTVDVEVEPLKAFDGAVDAINARAEEYGMRIAEEIENGGEEPSEEEITNVIFEYLMEYLNDNLDNITYGDKITVTVAVEKNKDGLFEITEESFMELDEALIDISEMME